jgi:hypothetical protein
MIHVIVYYTILKRLSEAVNRRTDKAMANRKRAKTLTMICKTQRRKLMIGQQESHKKQEMNSNAKEG